MQATYVENLVEDDWPALVGVRKDLFDHIFDLYCRDSVIDTKCARAHVGSTKLCRWKLFRVLYLLKTNPTYQQFRAETGVSNRAAIFETIWRHVRVLADRMLQDADSLWSVRRQLNGQAPEFAKRLFGDVTFLVDTFPVVILRSKMKSWRHATYQGKYKQFIMKCQVCFTCFSVLLSCCLSGDM